MKAAIKSMMLQKTPYMSADGGINVKGFAKALHINQAAVAEATGASRQVVSQHFNSPKRFVKVRNKTTYAFWTKLNQIYAMLNSMADADTTEKEINDWFDTPNISLSGERPNDLVRRGELDIIIKKLMDIINASHGA